MTNPVWPIKLAPQQMEWRFVKTGVAWRSPFTGSVQANDFMGDHWEVKIQLAGEGNVSRRIPQLEALMMYLAGGGRQIDIWNWKRPFPRGTLRGTPEVKIVTVRGDQDIVLTVAPGATLEAGDFIGAGDQVLMVRDYCEAVGTTLTVPLVNHIKTVIPETSAVVWNRPLLHALLLDMSAGVVYSPGMASPSQIILVEA